ncbi:MAG TPA: hypothetical protein VGR96_15730 [Acidobacteriaceae bacterium]|nr:hypothetical protein [Acidobacteriaceae bacterium]
MRKAHWIQKAIEPKDEGEFSKAAKRAGKTTAEYAEEHAGDAGKKGRQARLAEILMKLRKK